MIRFDIDDNEPVYCFRPGDPLFAAVEKLVLDAEATDDGDKEPKVWQKESDLRPRSDLPAKKTQ